MMLQESDLTTWRGWFPDLLVDAENSTVLPTQLKDLPGPIDSMNALALAYSRAPKYGRAEIVREALKVVGGEVNKVAEGLGISRSTVWRLGKRV